MTFYKIVSASSKRNNILVWRKFAVRDTILSLRWGIKIVVVYIFSDGPVAKINNSMKTSR